jgi:hypothetical protein
MCCHIGLLSSLGIGFQGFRLALERRGSRGYKKNPGEEGEAGKLVPGMWQGKAVKLVCQEYGRAR